MALPDYFICFDQHKHSSLVDFAGVLKRSDKKPVGSVQLSELCSISEYPHGLYLFFGEEDKLWYLGKSTSRSFIERVPSHFDQREDAWFNTVPKKIKDKCKFKSYQDALKYSLTLKIVLIGIQQKETTLELEKVLKSFLQPILNPGKKGNLTGKEIISTII